MTDSLEYKMEVIAETDNLIAWKGEESDGEMAYHIEVGHTMLTFYTEEWLEVLELMRQILKNSEK